MAVDHLHGMTVTFSSGFFGQITSLRWSGIARGAVPTSHSATVTWKTFRPNDLVDPGSIEIEGFCDHDVDWTTPITGATETITITWPLDTGETVAATWAASGFLTAFDAGGPTNDDDTAGTFTATLKLTGTPTVTAAT